jgi:chromosome segregation ATPase
VLDSHDWAEKAGGGSALPMKNIPLKPLPPEEEPKFVDITPAVASAEPPSDSEESDTPPRPGTSLSSRSGNKKYDLDSLIRNLESVTKRHTFEISTRRKRLEGLTALTAEQRKEHENETEKLDKLNKELVQIKDEMKNLQNDLTGIEQEKNTLETQLQDAKDKNLGIEAEKTTLEETIRQRDNAIEEKDGIIAAKEEEIREKDGIIAAKEEEIREKDSEAAAKDEEITTLNQKIGDLEKNHGDNTTQLKEQIKNLEEKIGGLEKDIQDKDNATGKLETEKRDWKRRLLT